MGRFALLVPPPLQGIILDFDWDRARLHALELPIDELGVSELRWQLDLPWWRVEDHVTETAPGRWTILDGVHRLLKADITGAQTILAKRVRDLEAIRITP